ncbi:hypothetical protein AB9M62_27900 [Bacillales bacterium AN1005]
MARSSHTRKKEQLKAAILAVFGVAVHAYTQLERNWFTTFSGIMSSSIRIHSLV